MTPQRHFKLALLGFGNVGQALAQLLLRKRDDIQAQYGITFSVTGIATGRHGRAVEVEGLDVQAALDLVAAGEPLTALSKVETADVPAFLRACAADVLFESIPVNYQDGQPAVDYIRFALENGMHVATANKGPVVHAYRPLTELARRVGKRFYFESAVMDGAPVFGLFRETLPAAHIRRVHGVLNSTTNLILTRM
ncbi:MAG: homoserine dehydrogenase, partial [Anaerolineae bacterium]